MLIRSCFCFCCVLGTLRLVCIAVKISKSCRLCAAPPFSQQSAVPPAPLVQESVNEYTSKEFRTTPQTSESFERACIYRKRSVVLSQTIELGFGGAFYFLPRKDIDVHGESDVTRGASQQGRKRGWRLGLFGMAPVGATVGS